MLQYSFHFSTVVCKAKMCYFLMGYENLRDFALFWSQPEVLSCHLRCHFYLKSIQFLFEWYLCYISFVKFPVISVGSVLLL